MALILWSGGLDSTLVLYHLLNQWHNGLDWESCPYKKEHGRPRTLSISCSQCSKAQDIEQNKARNRFRKFMSDKSRPSVLHWKFDECSVNINSSDNVYKVGGLPQVTLWLGQAALAINQNEPVAFGWIKSDDATREIKLIRKIWNDLCELNHKGDCPLWVPFEHHSKIEIIKNCNDLNILDKCWWCESPTKENRKYVKCGRCKPCETMLTALAKESDIDDWRKNYDKYLDRLQNVRTTVTTRF